DELIDIDADANVTIDQDAVLLTDNTGAASGDINIFSDAGTVALNDTARIERIANGISSSARSRRRRIKRNPSAVHREEP
ncbi:MAG: hypothetical protein QF652_06220, partial [Dehalococcoidia bacterium]|nr:hypothetical protein [Dehalococcoidia bacterium]